MVDTRASEVLPSIVRLVADLVRAPSRGGIDDDAPVIGVGERWLHAHRLTTTRIENSQCLVGIFSEVSGRYPRPRFVLDACLDTAPFGSLSAWRQPPTSADVVDCWLIGRGSAESKAGVALFCHVAAALRSRSSDMCGSLTVLFDADGHTGGFGGARAFFGAGSETGSTGVS